jgi:rSAM/selenodomain-associated transferase 1
MSAVLVMAKLPLPGRVKTRLHPLLGPGRAADLQAALIRHTIRLCGARPTFVSVDPPATHAAVADLVPERIVLLAQHGADLGERLTNAIDDVFTVHAGPLLVIGTDAPTLTVPLLDKAFVALADSDLVLGPACDGGYYLIGLNAPYPFLFDLDPALWGGDRVLGETLTRAVKADLNVHLLPELRDLDTPDDAAALLTHPPLPPEIAAILKAALAQ